jgi:hypothetical protein
MAYQVVARTDAPGPRVIFSDGDSTTYFTVGAYGTVNNLENAAGRALVITMPSGLRLVGLTTAPAGTPTTDLCVDANGNVYKQS